MRLIEKKKLPFVAHSYDCESAISGVEVAAQLNLDPARVFKTLVTTGKSGLHYVFVIPVAAELDLKKAAKSVSEKSIDMLKSKDLLALTGYIHGGCSPIGMKKFFITTVHESALEQEAMYFSAGKIGYQIEMAPKDLEAMIRLKYADIIVDK